MMGVRFHVISPVVKVRSELIVLAAASAVAASAVAALAASMLSAVAENSAGGLE